MKIFNKIAVVTITAALMLGIFGIASAATAVNLGTADSFAVLGGSTVTNTGPTVINGNLGLSPGTSVTGFPPGIVNGTQHVTDAVAAQAQADVATAYDAASGQTTGVTMVSGDLGGQTLAPGLYKSTSSLGLTGTVTLDGQGNPDTVFIFQIGSALTTASASRVALINGAQACNVFWQVGSSATLGTNSTFVGTILALSSITVNTGASVSGRVLARNGAVTLDTSPINKPTCAAPVVVPPPVTPAPTSAPVIATPTPLILTPTPIVLVVTPTSTPAATPVGAPAPATVQTSALAPTASVALNNLPNTGFSFSDWFSQTVNLAIPSGLFALAATLYLFRKKENG